MIIERLTHKERAERRASIAAYVRENGCEGAAAHFGVTLNSVRKACREHQVEIPRKPHTKGKAMADRTYVIISLMCNTTMTDTEIAEKVGTTKQWVNLIRHRCKSHCIPMKNVARS